MATRSRDADTEAIGEEARGATQGDSDNEIVHYDVSFESNSSAARAGPTTSSESDHQSGAHVQQFVDVGHFEAQGAMRNMLFKIYSE